MPNRALSQVFVVIAITSSLLMGDARGISQTNEAIPQKTQQQQALPQQESSCVSAVVQKIAFPGVDDPDQQTLRSMIPVREGKPLDRDQLRESLRILFATGRFTELSAECETAADGEVILSFANTPNHFIGLVRVEGAPAHPTESQIVNASKLQLGEPFSAEKMKRALENLKRLMAENEFYSAVITYAERELQKSARVRVHRRNRVREILLVVAHVLPLAGGKFVLGIKQNGRTRVDVEIFDVAPLAVLHLPHLCRFHLPNLLAARLLATLRTLLRTLSRLLTTLASMSWQPVSVRLISKITSGGPARTLPGASIGPGSPKMLRTGAPVAAN